MGFKIILDSQTINPASSKEPIDPNFPDIGIETRYIIKILKEMATYYASFRNQYRFKYQTVSSARFDDPDEDNKLLDGTELFISLNNNQNLTESDTGVIDVKSPLEQQIQN